MSNQNVTNTRKPVVFMSVDAFKKALGIQKLEVFIWDKDTANRKASNKLSCQDEFGNIYRCQQSIDANKPMAVILEKGAPIDKACLINTTRGESVFTFQFEAK